MILWRPILKQRAGRPFATRLSSWQMGRGNRDAGVSKALRRLTEVTWEDG